MKTEAFTDGTIQNLLSDFKKIPIAPTLKYAKGLFKTAA
jgi:hypothetical protein